MAHPVLAPSSENGNGQWKTDNCSNTYIRVIHRGNLTIRETQTSDSSWLQVVRR